MSRLVRSRAEPPVNRLQGVRATDNALRAMLYMSLAVLLFPFMNAMVKILRTEFDPAMIIWARYLGHFGFMFVLFFPRHRWTVFRTARPGIQIFRSLLLLGATFCYFTALGYVPLATAAIMGFTSPFIVTALSRPMLGERVGWRRTLAVCTGFIGALMVIRPGSGFLHPLAFLVLITATCYAVYQIMTRKISASENSATTITYTALVGAVVSCVAVPFYWQTPTDLRQIILLGLIGIVGGLGHYFVIKAFDFGQASLLAPLTYGQIVGATLLGYFLFGEFPDQWTWIGTSVIVGCGLFIAYREGVQRD